MMAHKQLLHELLKQEQEPFRLKSFIADRRSQLKKSSTLHFKTRSNLCKHVCFCTHDVTKSPFIGFMSPAMSPCKSPAAAAGGLVEAAVRIQKQRRAKPKSQIKNVGVGLFGTFLKRLKERNKSKKRVFGDGELRVLTTFEPKERENFEGDTKFSCSCNLEASSSTEELVEINDGDFTFRETRLCPSPVSPFRFSLDKSPSSSGHTTPELCSPAASPGRHVQQEKENNATGNSNNVRGEEEEKEQCSPVSVLDPFFEDEGHKNAVAEEEEEEEDDDNYDLECSYANVQRGKEQLLHRLRRFEKLAELDPVELEKNLLEVSDDNEYERESVESGDGDFTKLFVRRVISPSNLRDNHPRKMSTDLIKENKIICLASKKVVLGRICNSLGLWKKVEFDAIDTMIELGFKREFEGRRNYPDEVEETVAEVEVAIFERLVEELSEDFVLDGLIASHL